MKKEHFFTIIFLVISIQCLTQNESIITKEIHIFTEYLDSTGLMLSQSTGYAIEYDNSGDGYPIDLKYSSDERLKSLAKANEYYLKTSSAYKIVESSLTNEQIKDFKSIDNSLMKIINDTDYEKYLSITNSSLPIKEIFPTVTFIEIVKAKIDKFSNSIDDIFNSKYREVNQKEFIKEK